MGVIAKYAEQTPARPRCDPLHHQHAIEPQDIDTVTHPCRIIIVIDHDLIAVIQSRRHRFAVNADD